MRRELLITSLVAPIDAPRDGDIRWLPG